MNSIKIISTSIISALVGLVMIPMLALDFSFDNLPLLIVYFLPALCIGLIVLFELLTRIRSLRKVYSFIRGTKMIVLFSILLIIQQTIMWQIHSANDIVFTSQFITATIPAIMVYAYLGEKWTLLSAGDVK